MPKRAILCVDDEKIVLNSLRDQIARHFGKEYLCEVAESADEALEIVDELVEDGIQILIVVSDWLMPQKKGDELLREIHLRDPSIVTVLLTGQADEEAIARLQEQVNLHSYITKPWDEAALVETLRSGLGKMRA